METFICLDSFNLAHCLSYSIVGLQEMNLAFRYPVIFWNCANLIIDSGATEDETEDEDEDENPNASAAESEDEDSDDEEDEDDDEEEPQLAKKKKKPATKSVNYGKISTAIGKMRTHGINVTLPDINASKYGFSVDVEHNIIRYGIKGITGIGDAVVKDIIAARPYESIDDFLSKVKVKKTQVINLIKSGCFDELIGSREEAMREYLTTIADIKKRLTLQNMPGLIREGLIPESMRFFATLFDFNKYLKKNKDDLYYNMDSGAYDYYAMFFDTSLIVENGEGAFAILQKDWDKIYKKAMNPMREFLKNPDNGMLDIVNNHAIDVVTKKYATGTINKWEMQSVGFYYSGHELDTCYNRHRISIYDLTPFEELDENPQVAYTVKNKQGAEVPIYKLDYIAGTVISKDKIKHTVTLLTDCGVVNVKVWDAQFTKYDKQISMRGEDGKKKILERSWFTRGNKLLILGFRRGDTFVPRTYRSGGYMSVPIAKIEDDLSIVYERVGEE